MTLPLASALRTCAGEFSVLKTDAGAAGRNRRSAGDNGAQPSWLWDRQASCLPVSLQAGAAAFPPSWEPVLLFPTKRFLRKATRPFASFQTRVATRPRPSRAVQ